MYMDLIVAVLLYLEYLHIRLGKPPSFVTSCEPSSIAFASNIFILQVVSRAYEAGQQQSRDSTFIPSL